MNFDNKIQILRNTGSCMVTNTSQERFRTYNGVFDNFTNRTLFFLETHGHITELSRTLFVGKESNVFTTEVDDEHRLVKIYRVQNCDFKQMYRLILQDPRFRNIRHRPREVIFTWAQREYTNLLKAKEAGVRVPTMYAWRNHILVEELIGDPAPRLKDAVIDNLQECADDILENYRKLYGAGIVHGDLSGFNMLYHENKVWFIDFSQGISIQSDYAQEYLRRDLVNVQRFFHKRGLTLDIEHMVNFVTKV